AWPRSWCSRSSSPSSRRARRACSPSAPGRWHDRRRSDAPRRPPAPPGRSPMTTTHAPPPASPAAPAAGRRTVPSALLVAGAAALALAAAPLLLDEFRLGLLTRYLCYAIAAVGIAVAWGRGGMLTLGHGVFFGIGAYAMAAHMTLANTPDGGLPSFMVWNGLEALPALWVPFRSLAATLAAVVLLPGAVALLLGWAVFRRRV